MPRFTDLPRSGTWVAFISQIAFASRRALAFQTFMRLVNTYIRVWWIAGVCMVVVSGDVGNAGISTGLAMPRFVRLQGDV